MVKKNANGWSRDLREQGETTPSKGTLTRLLCKIGSRSWCHWIGILCPQMFHEDIGHVKFNRLAAILDFLFLPLLRPLLSLAVNSSVSTSARSFQIV